MTDTSANILESGNNKNTNVALNIFWFGFIIYAASFAISTTYAVSFILCQYIQITGLILLTPAAFILIKFKFDNSYLRTIYILYCIWLLITILRGIILDYGNIKSMLFDAEFGLLRYFVPLILLFPKNLVYFKKVFIVAIILGVIFIIYDILFINNLRDLNYVNFDTKFTFEYFVKTLSVPIGFIMLTYAYHNDRTKLFALLVIVVGAGFSIFRARRALLFMSVGPLFISYLLYLYAGKKKFITIIFSLILGTGLFFYGLKVFTENKSGMFSLLNERMYEDTRSTVEDSFYRDMSIQDWIIGKGYDGQYYCPGIDIGIISGYRGMIETDYLNIILKGGIISLILLLLIALPAVVKGLFYSNNLLSKAAALWILFWLMELYPANVNSFSLNNLLVWISIGLCYSSDLRNLSEDTVAEVLYKKKTDIKDRKLLINSDQTNLSNSN